ncbi:MAG: hypothetical protein AYL29_009530 [Candidatus Bathyarchaeota archaeon B24]|nr:MAG: hypothetical protein AYL29_009530 [Candidatus Bathyarchaeota archaeon B24]
MSMLITKFKSHRKALSPVVATLLLIVLAVAATAILWTWVSNMISGATGSEELMVEKAVLATSTKIKIQIRNIGTVTAEIAEVTVEKTDAFCSWKGSKSVKAGEVVVIDVTSEGEFSRGDIITITVTTKNGNEFIAKLSLQ